MFGIGNWSLYTSSFSDLPLYGYYNPLSAESVLEVEEKLFDLIEREGPFDGVLGFSAGAAVAAQLICSDASKHPFKTPEERPFRWAVLFGAITPLKVFKLEDEEIQEGTIEPNSEMAGVVQAALDEFLRPSATRERKTFHRRADMPDADAIRAEVQGLETRLLADGTPFFTDGKLGMTRFDARFHGQLIDIPTLHVRCPDAEDGHSTGEQTLALCDPELVTEIHHTFGHDFPRGHQLLKKISAAIRETADKA